MCWTFLKHHILDFYDLVLKFPYGGQSWHLISLTFKSMYLSICMVDDQEISNTWPYDIALTYLYGGRSCNITAASLRQAFHLQLFAANLRLFSICDSFAVRLRFVYSLSFKGTAKKPQGNCKCDLSHICSPIAVCLLLVCSSGCN